MAVCNILNLPEGLEPETLFEGGFSEENFKVLGFAGFEEEALQVSPQDSPNTLNGGWFPTKERLGDGFQATFSFTFDAGTSDGFAFVVQDDSTDLLGNGGPSLGFSDGFLRYMGIGFDFCADRGACTTQQLRIETNFDGGNKEVRGETTDANLFNPDNVVGAPVTVDVIVNVLENPAQVEVFLNGEERLVVTDLALSSILADRVFSFFGFTSSNSEIPNTDQVALNLQIDNLRIDQFLSRFKMEDQSLIAATVDSGQTVVFEVQQVDECNIPVAISQVDVDDIVATLVDNLDETNIIEPLAIDISAEAITITFITPVIDPTTYTLNILVNDVVVQQNPLVAHVVTQDPAQNGLNQVGVAVLASLLGLLALVAILVLVAWNRYRSKLSEHAEDIKYGKTKKKIDGIDQTINYEMNPMVATLDKLKERLATNERTIAEMKEAQQNAIDSDYTVEQLQEENAALRAEMQDLKKQQEYAVVGNNRTSNNFRGRFFGRRDKRDDFGQQNA